MKAWHNAARRLTAGLILLFGGSHLLHAQAAPARGTRDAPLSVCDLFADLRSFDLKRVTVRGELFDSPYGFSMAEADCEGREFVQYNFGWPTVVDLFPASEENFKEQAIIQKIRDTWKTGRPHAVGTVTGILHVPSDDQLKRDRGFGGLGNFPAQIRYERVEDIEFELLPSPNELPVTSVCDLFADLQQYRSKRVAVRGQLTTGYHGSFLFDVCPQLPVLGGVKAATTISLRPPGYYPGQELAADFGIDRPIESMAAEPPLEELKRGRKSVRVWATFVGVLRAMEVYSAMCMEGRARPLGFGHMNLAPAELLVEASYGFKVEPSDSDVEEPEMDRCPPNPLEDGKSCNQRDNLTVAVAAGCQQRVVQLLKAGADPNESNVDGETPLLASIHQGFTELSRVLLDAGARADDGTWQSPLCEAILYDRAETVRLLVEHGARVQPAATDKCLPLARAAAFGSVETVQFLLQSGADPNYRAEGKVPLAAASGPRRTEKLRLLLSAGADPNGVDGYGEAFLPTYGFFDRAVTRELIRAGASVDATAGGGQTALMGACKYGYRAVAELLLDAGADPNRKDQAGNTPLMHAVRGGYVDCIPLLAAHGADFTAVNLEGKTARDLVTGDNARYLFEALDQFGQAAP